jgi:hypothetical protein
MRAVSYFAPFLVALSLTPAIGAETAVDRAKEDEIVSVPKGDPDMEEAFRQARETPKGFLDLARAPRSRSPAWRSKSPSTTARLAGAARTEQDDILGALDKA